MHIVSKIIVGLIAILHAYIMIFEMFLWESRGPTVFSSFPKELFTPTKALAANQGLYNGFLAAGLIWAIFFIKDIKWQKNIAVFFLLCITIAGIYGSLTASVNIIFVQTIPALIAIASLYVLKSKYYQ